jgi:rare lipoprotein A (peptidoglycan hydrolase)
VIDRGPYANNASWDLTIATSNALNFTSVGVDRIGALILRGRPAPL